MPQFTPRMTTIEAHQWRGNLAALPLDFAAAVELQGRRDPLVHTGAGSFSLPEMSWLLRAVDGRFEVLTDGAFQQRYHPHSDPVPVSTGTLSLKGKNYDRTQGR